MCERVSSGNVVHQQSAHCSFVVRTRDRLKLLLPRCVPYLYFDNLVVQLYRLRSELNANCELMLQTKLVVRELEEYARFANGYVWLVL